MAELTYNVTVKANVSDSSEDAQKLLGREVVAGIALGTDGNMNIEDIEVVGIDATEVIVKKTDCMPDKEISSL